MIRNEKGSIPLIISSLIVLSILIYAVFSGIDNSRHQVEAALKHQAKRSILDKDLALLRSDYIVNFSLSKYNTPGTNTALKSCMMAPEIDTTCSNVNIDFYFPGSASDEKIAGGTSSPAYVDVQGNPCLDSAGQPTDSCMFKVLTTCRFSCPGNQQNCPLDKVMSCDLQISSYKEGFLKTLIFSDSNKIFAASYAIHIANDLSSFYVVPF